MFTIDPKNIPTIELQTYLQSAVAPRPIALASTINKDGIPNLSPFSFFNVFSANPPILIFSPARRIRDNTTKHTLENVLTNNEVVINVVNYSMVEQTSLASTEYPENVNEFIKAGFTPIPSEVVKPFRVKESPVHFECKVNQVIHLGNEGGAGNLVICEILKIHIDEKVLNEHKKIDVNKIDLVARLGGDYYCRASGNAIFEVEKPLVKLGIGIDQIPQHIRFSSVLTGNDLGKLGNVEKLPTPQEVGQYIQSGAINEIFEIYGHDLKSLDNHLHHIAQKLLSIGKVEEAWKVLLSDIKF